MDIVKNIEAFEQKLSGTGGRLVAVSKTKPVEIILEAYQAGLRDFGENRVQELRQKAELLPVDIRWHMIGHLQTNKVKQIATFVHLIHSIDSFKLLKEINKQGERNQRTLNCLLQVHIAMEESKFGFSEVELKSCLASGEFSELSYVQVSGLMGMASFTSDTAQVRTEFRNLKALFEDLKANCQGANCEMKELSMGMTSDYEIALEEGSTLIRVGTAIFGARN